jgi:hypothetical protein
MKKRTPEWYRDTSKERIATGELYRDTSNKSPSQDVGGVNNLVDAFMNDSESEDNSSLISNSNLSEPEVRQIQSALNIFAMVFPKNAPPTLEVDGVFGSETYARWKQFYNMLPKETRMLLKPEDNPLLDVDGKV